ncbi:hypothetical protein [Thermococcus sp.]|uniref:hypothetical protein n=1 Tax=Thermococcus sp. TaxID=35749 RepID=UPI0026193210|nr:hypothetical protein [Thermococcus sp.]
MNGTCVEYFTCFEYRIPTKQLCIKTCNNTELRRLLRRRGLEEVLDVYARQSIIRLVEIELLRRGKVSEAGLLGAVLDESPTTGVKVYYNNASLVVAVKTFFTADCLLND